MDTVTGISSHFENPNAESIEVTPTIYQNDDFENQDLTSESNGGKLERTGNSVLLSILWNNHDVLYFKLGCECLKCLKTVFSTSVPKKKLKLVI